MLGSFCLFVGNRAVTFDDGLPATCGSFACTSSNVAANAGTTPSANAPLAAAATTAEASRPDGFERCIVSPAQRRWSALRGEASSGQTRGWLYEHRRSGLPQTP